MTRVTVDSATQFKLQGAEPLIVCNEAGKVLGFFQPANVPEGIKSPFSDEEIERRRQIREGAPLSDVLRRLGV
jgi:hypothetical protein